MFGIDDAALAIMLAGGITTAGSLYANRKNIDYQREANALNMQIAQMNNATQIEMANTAHEREVRDLRRAGLNPILSAGGNGASTPTLQAPNIDPVHMDNNFEGLANSAKGLTRYLGAEAKRVGLENESLEVNNQGSRIANDMDQNNLEFQRAEQDSMRGALTADFMRNKLDQVATSMETGLDANYNPKTGLLNVDIRDPRKFKESLDLAREGLRSDLKQRANANWRANLSSFVPFVSPAAINSAAGVRRQWSGVHSIRRIP